MPTWPNFFIGGMGKAGTTSLYLYLKKIPGVYMSPVKEPRYFAPIAARRYKEMLRIDDEERYLELFKDVKDETAIGEASVAYWRDPQAAKLIHDQIPHAKIIISLRDPVERFFSGYLMQKRRRRLKTSFKEHFQKSQDRNNKKHFLINYLMLDPPFYYENIKRFLDIFDRKQIKIIVFEEWITNTKETVQEILDFLEVDYSINENVYKAYNSASKRAPRGQFSQYILKSKTARKIVSNLIPSTSRNYVKKNLLQVKSKPKMNDEDRNLLINYYQYDVRKLENLLERKFP